MAQVVQAQELPKAVRDHLILEAEVYQAEDQAKTAKAQERKVFRQILKEKGLTKEYQKIVKELRKLRAEKDLPELIEDKKYRRLRIQKLRIEVQVKGEKAWIEANEVAKAKAREFREKFKELRKDFEVSIKPFYL